MRFTVEERHLTDSEGRPITAMDAVSFHTVDAESIDEAVRLYIGRDGAQIIGDVLKFPGYHAVATMRRSTGVYTLQFTPASQAFSI
jgi:hypothetical protein